MIRDANGEEEERETSPAAALVMMFESLPEEFQEAVFEIVTDFFHLARAAGKDPVDGVGALRAEKDREKG
jgi:hypothetical protein